MAEEKREERKEDEAKLFAVRTVAGRELDVALIMEARARSENLPIKSIIVLPRVKGYILVEAPAQHYVAVAAHGIRYAKGVVPGVLRLSDVERLLKPEAVVETLKPGEIVEIVAGPFKGMRAEVVRVDTSRNEVVLNLLDASVQYSLQITVPGDSVRPVKGEERK